MFGVEARSIPALYAFGIYAIPEIAWVGSHETLLTKQAVPYETGVARYKDIARGQILGDLNGMLKLIFHLDTRKLLGVWSLGTQATELVHIGQAVMGLGGTLDYFVEGVFNYPTLAECYKVAGSTASTRSRSWPQRALTVQARRPAHSQTRKRPHWAPKVSASSPPCPPTGL